MSVLSPINEIIDEIRRGRMVVLVDEEDRENEGDLVIAAEHVSPEVINFMARHGRGLICLTLTPARCKQLGLGLMVKDNRSPFSTAFTVSIEAASGVTTGISAHDRARTVRAAVARDARPDDLVQPGHIFPLMAQEGGVLVRAGHTEAGSDLARLAGLEAASVICEILNEDGSMARMPDLLEFAREHHLKIGAIRDLIQYRAHSEALVRRETEKTIITAHGPFRLYSFADTVSGELHLALAYGEITPAREALVRVHEPISVLDFLDPDSSRHTFSVDQALARIAAHGNGVAILLRRHEAGEEVLARLAPERFKHAARRWDPRIFGIGAQILRDLGVGRMRVLASPRKIPSMAGFGLEITAYDAPASSEDGAEA